MLISVGTSATSLRASSPNWSGFSAVPCSRQSIPAAISPGRASSPNTCAVTRAPRSCAVLTASARTSSGQSGARSPFPRSIQSPTSLTQPSPSRACSATAAGSSAGSSSSTPRPGMYRLASARCRPARMIVGRSARRCSGRTSIGRPQSRISSVPASRSAIACSTASSMVTGPPMPMPGWQCASTRPGTRKPLRTSVSAPGTGSNEIFPPVIHSSPCSPPGRTVPARCSAVTGLFWAAA